MIRRWRVGDSGAPYLIKAPGLKARSSSAADTLPSDHDREGKHHERVEHEQYLRRHMQCTPMGNVSVNFRRFTRYTLVYCQKTVH